MSKSRQRFTKSRRADLEEKLLYHIREAGLPEPVREYRIVDKPAFRYDFAWPEQRILCEVNGGTFRPGGHSTGVGIRRDARKLNTAQMLGWDLYVFTGDWLRGDIAECIDVLRCGLQGGPFVVLQPPGPRQKKPGRKNGDDSVVLGASRKKL